jgi:hypothetical protein
MKKFPNMTRRIYIWIELEHDGSEGASENADEMLQAALEANSHVMHLQTFKTKPIPYPKLQEIVPGSEEEARYIWLLLSVGLKATDDT